MKTIPQQDQSPRPQGGDLLGKTAQGLSRVIGRQHLAACGIGRPLFEVQICHHQGLMLF
jgi:hypothetical protein